ncbi:MAG: hypothetical protein Q8936_17260 [Bacillota bacterium]|nr:hypothetical protein [Bacillota bacterium]
MQKRNYGMKRTISMKGFISEFGENFSQHIKDRLLELEVRCVLTRKEHKNMLDLKHVEHTHYPCNQTNDPDNCEKEYVYAQLIVDEGILYFSNQCVENDKIMRSPIVNTMYDALSSTDMITVYDTNAKKIDDTNIDYLIDTILTACPEVSQKYKDILKQMTSYASK